MPDGRTTSGRPSAGPRIFIGDSGRHGAVVAVSDDLAHRVRAIVALLAAQFAMLVWYGAGDQAPASVATIIAEPTSSTAMYAVSAVAIGWVALRWLVDWRPQLPSGVFVPRDESPASGDDAPRTPGFPTTSSDDHLGNRAD